MHLCRGHIVRRLSSDYHSRVRLLTDHPYIQVSSTIPDNTCSLYSPLPLRSGDALEVVRYDSTTGVPSMVTAEDVGVSNPLIISGNISTGDVESEYIYEMKITCVI